MGGADPARGSSFEREVSLLGTQRPLETVVQFTTWHGGGTFNPWTLAPLQTECGFAVGGRMSWIGSVSAPILFRPKPIHVLADLRQAVTLARIEQCYVGTWLSEGQLVIELTDVYPDVAMACKVGVTREQNAIYSFAVKRDIPVNIGYPQTDSILGDRDAAS